MNAVTTPEASYVAGDDGRYFYPGAGDPHPPGGAKVLLLTKGGVCTVGQWSSCGAFLGWCPLPKRDHVKESKL